LNSVRSTRSAYFDSPVIISIGQENMIEEMAAQVSQ
jgi:hypothetical protein